MGERYVDVGKVRSRSRPLRAVASQGARSYVKGAAATPEGAIPPADARPRAKNTTQPATGPGRRTDLEPKLNRSRRGIRPISTKEGIVDNYLAIVDRVSDTIESMEDEIIARPREDMISEIQLLKKKATFLQKSIVPAREVISRIERNNHMLIQEGCKPYFRDLNDHIIQIAETLASYREIGRAHV